MAHELRETRLYESETQFLKWNIYFDTHKQVFCTFGQETEKDESTPWKFAKAWEGYKTHIEAVKHISDLMYILDAKRLRGVS